LDASLKGLGLFIFHGFSRWRVASPGAKRTLSSDPRWPARSNALALELDNAAFGRHRYGVCAAGDIEFGENRLEVAGWAGTVAQL
jgi:hypothetical protein